MKNTILYVFCLTSIVFLSSCGKVVDLEYQNNYDRLVVEALLVKDESTHKIKVSHEINYFETPEFKPVEDVIITISDESGNIGTFYYIDSGYFGLDNYNINYNTNYTLSLKDGDKIVEASCKTSSEIILDTVLTTYYALDNENSTTALKPIFIDPANEKNYYLTGFSEIGFTQNNYYSKYSMFTDELMDGQTNNNAIPVYYQSGDTIEFRLRSVDYYRYQFIKTFEESYNDGGFFNASPSNPISNFKDQALGYFSVEVEERMTVLIP